MLILPSLPDFVVEEVEVIKGDVCFALVLGVVSVVGKMESTIKDGVYDSFGFDGVSEYDISEKFEWHEVQNSPVTVTDMDGVNLELNQKLSLTEKQINSLNEQLKEIMVQVG